jgi:hypothetical protein
MHVINDEHDAFFVLLSAGQNSTWGLVVSRPRQPEAAAANVFQFSLAGLIVFTLALIAGASFLTYKLTAGGRPKLADTFVVDPNDKSRSVHVGPWGELVTRDISLERPAEYLTAEVSDPQPEVWTFTGLKPDALKAFLVKNGLTDAQAAAALAPGTVAGTSTGTQLTPSADFLYSLSPETRQKLYAAFAGYNINLYLDYPYIFPANTIASIYADDRLQPDDVALLKRLVYPNGSAQQLADYQFLLNQIPTADRRVALSRALSRQSAVFAGLAIKPDTDIDKLASYWGNMPNVRFTDIRPLMESLKRLPEGGNLSLLYLLPKFARDRLYTFPLPPLPGDPIMDCHWTTFNFSSDTPDNRFNDPAYAVQFIQKNYYQIAAPSLYGDVLLLMNDKNEIKHSAVFLADDLVYTKNGNNYRQPWMIMRISDLLATYPDNPPMRPIYMRLKVD